VNGLYWSGGWRKRDCAWHGSASGFRRHINWRGDPHVSRRQKRVPDSPGIKPLQKMLNFPLANTEGIFYREELVLLLCFFIQLAIANSRWDLRWIQTSRRHAAHRRAFCDFIGPVQQVVGIFCSEPRKDISSLSDDTEFILCWIPNLASFGLLLTIEPIYRHTWRILYSSPSGRFLRCIHRNSQA